MLRNVVSTCSSSLCTWTALSVAPFVGQRLHKAVPAHFRMRIACTLVSSTDAETVCLRRKCRHQSLSVATIRHLSGSSCLSILRSPMLSVSALSKGTDPGREQVICCRAINNACGACTSAFDERGADVSDSGHPFRQQTPPVICSVCRTIYLRLIMFGPSACVSRGVCVLARIRGSNEGAEVIVNQRLQRVMILKQRRHIRRR